MSSDARQLANGANAQHSTGPRTEEGKARSSQNARKHGLTASAVVILAEDRAEFEELLAQYEADIRPVGGPQLSLFEQLVEAAWQLRRVRRLETELLSAAPSFSDLINDETAAKKLDRLARHKTRIERSFYRALKELKELQTNDALAHTLPAVVVETSPPLASMSQFAKRTQSLARGPNLSKERDTLELLPYFCNPAPTRNQKLETSNELTEPSS